MTPPGRRPRGSGGVGCGVERGGTERLDEGPTLAEPSARSQQRLAGGLEAEPEGGRRVGDGLAAYVDAEQERGVAREQGPSGDEAREEPLRAGRLAIGAFGGGACGAPLDEVGEGVRARAEVEGGVGDARLGGPLGLVAPPRL